MKSIGLGRDRKVRPVPASRSSAWPTGPLLTVIAHRQGSTNQATDGSRDACSGRAVISCYSGLSTLADMPDDMTLLLKAASQGDQPALNRLIALLYVDLRQLAHRCRRGDDRAPDTTALVHECYLRFLDSGQLQVNDRAHFFNLAARVMRQLLVDFARERLAEKRGGGAAHVELRDDDAIELAEAERTVAIDQALETLAVRDPEQVRVVVCRFFGGLTEQETAEATGRSLRSVQRDWKAAREWLAEALAV